MWPVLGKRDGNLQRRLCLFDTCVTPCVLWCCETWLLTDKEKRLLKTTQNQMLRRIAGPRRALEESWVNWIQRSTRKARAYAKQAGLRSWLDIHYTKKWLGAGHVARMGPERLAHRGMSWRDSRWWMEERLLPVRFRTTRPHKQKWFRWEDDLRRFAESNGWPDWTSKAMCRSSWQGRLNAFLVFMRR